MAEYEAANRVDYGLYRKYPDIFETVEWKLNQELAEKILNELADGKAKLVTLGPVQRIDDNTQNAVRFTRGVKIESLVRCQECIFWDTSWNPGVGMKGEAYYCPRCHLFTLKDSFCSGACRKDGGQKE